MSVLSHTAVDDLISATLPGFTKDKWVQLAQTQQDYMAWSYIMKQNRMVESGGENIEWNLWLDQEQTARAVGLFAQDTVDVPTLMTTASAPWVNITWNTAWDVKEKFFNQGSRAIYDHIKIRMEDSALGAIKFFENQLWGTPTSVTDGVSALRGFHYWLHIDTGTSATGGFNGPHAVGSTTAGVTHDNWKHWVESYTNVADDDLVDGMREAATKTMFESPVGLTQFKEAGGKPRRAIYTTYTIKRGLEELARNQNDQLGFDMDPTYGKTLFRGAPIEWSPTVDGLTAPSGRLYMIDWNTFKFRTLAGNNLRKTGPVPAPNQHDTRVVHTDITCQFTCENRRQNAVFALSA